MPILKTEILGSLIEISYEKNEYDKLISLIETFKERLKEFPNTGKVNDKNIIFLAALKAEDQLWEKKNLLEEYNDRDNSIKDQNTTIKKLNKEIIFLKDEISEMKSSSASEKNHNITLIEEINKMNVKIVSIQKKIKDSI